MFLKNNLQQERIEMPTSETEIISASLDKVFQTGYLLPCHNGFQIQHLSSAEKKD